MVKKLLSMLMLSVGLACLTGHGTVLLNAGYTNVALLTLSHALGGSSAYHLEVADHKALIQAGQSLEVALGR